MAFLGSFFRTALGGGDSGESTASEDAASSAAVKPRPGRRGGRTGGSRRKPGTKAKDTADAVVTKPSAALNRMVHGFPFADAEILVGKDAERFPVHSVILSMSSPVLKEQFYGGGSELKKTSVTLPEADPESFKAVLKYAYTDDWGGNATLVLKIRRIANSLKMKELMDQLTKSVEENLSAADAVGVMQAATEEGDSHLMKAALEAALGDAEEAIHSKSVKFLVPESLGSLVAREDFGAPEIDIVEACLQWAAFRLGLKPGRTDDKTADSAGAQDDEAAAGGTEGASEAAAAASGAGADDGSAAADDAAASGGAAEPVLTGTHPKAMARVDSDIVVGHGPAIRAELEPHILPHLRFPLIKAKVLATRVKPWGVLTSTEVVKLLTYQFQTRAQQKSQARVAKFLSAPRSGVTPTLLIHCWGAGGASGQDSSCARGGAGGYICVRYEPTEGEELEIYVGNGGYCDASGSTSSVSTMAWPNGGCGGYSWNSGGGGGASFVKSKLHGGEVIVGAGGGGGGTAPRSWACGGGGGGGTKDGRVGKGGKCGNQPSPEGEEGTDGGGRGGKGETGGSGSDGKNANGAGGGSGSSTSAEGGAGGDASFKHCELVKRIDASSDDAITVTVGGRTRSHGKGAPAGRPKARGTAGQVIVENEDTGEIKVFSYSSSKGSTGAVQKYVVE